MKGTDHKNKFLLTHREREVFELLVQDKTTRDIAQLLFISEKTVRNHISNIVYFQVRTKNPGAQKRPRKLWISISPSLSNSIR